jgi:hypothetical protein
VLAWLDYESSLCGGCGGYLPETTDPDASFLAEPPYRCKRCDVVETMQQEYEDQKNPRALRVWPAVKTN